ncbi:SMI1/KNR4 family protein [Streptomyces sp. NPDC002644]
MAESFPTVTVSWDRIDTWLAARAPASLGMLAPPAAEAEIEEAARLLGVPLPPELAESLRRHDGVTRWATVLPEQAPLSAAGIVERRRVLAQVAAENDGLTTMPWNDEPWWHPRWIPWAEDAGGGVEVVDTRPGPHRGRLGWAGHGGGGDFTDAWPCLAALLHAVAEALHHGGDVRGLHPYLTAEGTLWWDAPDTPDALDGGEPLVPAPVGLP